MKKEIVEDIARAFPSLDEKGKDFMSGVIVGFSLGKESNIKNEVAIETNESSSLGG